MTTSFYNGISGFKSFQSGIDILGDNIANINTTSFKEKIPEFSSLFSQTISSTIVESDKSFGTKLYSTAIDTSMGSLKDTNNPFDLAIKGDGWFKVNYNGKEYYTRDGSFKRDKEGFLVNDNGAYLMVANANNILKTQEGYIIKNSSTSTLLPTSSLSPISLPSELTLPAVPTKNVNITLNLDDEEKIQSTYPATEESDFSAVYNELGEDLKVRNGNDLIISYGDKVTYNGQIEYEICIDNDKIDKKDVIYDFSINNKQIKIALPDGSSKQEIQTKLKEALDKANILNEITPNGIKIKDKNKLIITSNTSLIKNLSAAKIEYTQSPSKEFEFNTISSLENIIYNLAKNVYTDFNIIFEKGKITLINNSSSPINSFLLKGNNSNEKLYNSLYPLINTIAPKTTAKSTQFNINKQSIGGEIYDSNGEKNTLSLEFTKQKVLNSNKIWNLNIYLKEQNNTLLKTIPITFNEEGFLIYPKTIKLSSPPINIDISKITSYQKVKEKTNYLFFQDGLPKGDLKSYQIDNDGKIEAIFSNNKSVTVGQIPIFHFINDQGLSDIGKNLFKETQNSGKGELFEKNGKYISGAEIKSGFLETSNVNFANAMTELIITQKAFSASAKTVTTSNEMIKRAIEMKK